MAHPMDDLVVEDVEAHRRQRHAQHYVDGAEPDGRVPRVDRGEAAPGIRARHHVAEADCAQAHEAEIACV